MDYNEVALRLERLANERNVTPTKAFVDSGVGKDFAGNIRRGYSPSADKLMKISNYFNVSIDYILGNAEQKEKPVDNDELARFNETDRQTLREIKNLPPEDQTRLLDYIRLLKSRRH